MDEKTTVADFLKDIDEPQNIFKEREELEGPVEPIEEEKPLPFHKDPKVQRYIEKQIENKLKDRTPTSESQFRRETEDLNLPSSFVELVGNDTPEKQKVLKDLSEYFSTLKGDAKKEFLADLQAQEQQKVEADKKAQEELDTYFEEIEETYGVDLSSNTASAKQTRSQFIDYVRKIAPKDANGEVAAFPDLIGAFEDFQERLKRPPATRAKELANRGMTRSSDTSAAVPQGRSWKDVERHFNKLKESN